MAPKKYFIYASPTLDRVLAKRMAAPDADREDGFRSRSGLLNAIADRYDVVCSQSMPRLPLAAWCLIFDSQNGCWVTDSAQLAASGIAQGLYDDCSLNRKHVAWGLSDEEAMDLVHAINAMPLAEQTAILDAAERFWALNLQPDGTPPTEADPHAHWRAPVRSLVGPLADD